MKNKKRSALIEPNENLSKVVRTFSLYDRKLSVLESGHSTTLWDQASNRLLDTSKPVLASIEWKKSRTAVGINNVEVGGRKLAVMAGPCSIESEDQLREIAYSVKWAGATILRGGAYKPRASPYAFQGLGEEGLHMLKKVGDELDMPVVTEILSEHDISKFIDAGIDIVQIGAVNALNYKLISSVAKSGMTILLKRGSGSLIDQWLFAAEYALNEGNGNVLLCERGIRKFTETNTRYTFDLDGMSQVKRYTHLPVGADPSHPAGRNDLVQQYALDAAGHGAEFLLVEVHRNPSEAFSDGKQQLDPKQFSNLMRKLKVEYNV